MSVDVCVLINVFAVGDMLRMWGKRYTISIINQHFSLDTRNLDVRDLIWMSLKCKGM